VEDNNQEKSKGLMPGQEHEDELDLVGAALVEALNKVIEWIKHLFAVK